MKKQVVNSSDELKIHVDQCNDNDKDYAYGIYTHDGCKGFVTRESNLIHPLMYPNYHVLWAKTVTNGNLIGSVKVSDDTLQGLLKKMLRFGGWTVYQFGSPQELYAWLAVSTESNADVA